MIFDDIRTMNDIYLDKDERNNCMYEKTSHLFHVIFSTKLQTKQKDKYCRNDELTAVKRIKIIITSM